jgi:hypothetical protein
MLISKKVYKILKVINEKLLMKNYINRKVIIPFIKEKKYQKQVIFPFYLLLHLIIDFFIINYIIFSLLRVLYIKIILLLKY